MYGTGSSDRVSPVRLAVFDPSQIPAFAWQPGTAARAGSAIVPQDAAAGTCQTASSPAAAIEAAHFACLRISVIALTALPLSMVVRYNLCATLKSSLPSRHLPHR